jgi:homoserine kinase type II
MAQFRNLSRSDIEEILVGFGFAASDYRGHRPIAAGTINTNIAVETVHGRRFLRVNEGKSEDDVAREAAIVDHLAASGLPTPRPARAVDGRSYSRWAGELVSLFPWVEGRVLGRPELTASHAAQVGLCLARLHRSGASFPDHRPGRYEPDEIARRVARIATEVAGAGAGAEPALVEAMRRIEPELRQLAHERSAAEVPLGLIHGDLFVDNVLFSGDAGEARLVALLDFEQASWGRLIYDVAVTTLAFAFGRDDFRTELVAALLTAYESERPFSESERHLFGAELRFAACRFAVTRITDVHLKRVTGAPQGKDFRRYLARLDRLRERLQLDPQSFLRFEP